VLWDRPCATVTCEFMDMYIEICELNCAYEFCDYVCVCGKMCCISLTMFAKFYGSRVLAFDYDMRLFLDRNCFLVVCAYHRTVGLSSTGTHKKRLPASFLCIRPCKGSSRVCSASLRRCNERIAFCRFFEMFEFLHLCWELYKCKQSLRNTHKHTHTHTYAITHTRTCTRIHTHVHAQALADTHTNINPHIHLRVSHFSTSLISFLTGRAIPTLLVSLRLPQRH
jgi:hypothetical protein